MFKPSELGIRKIQGQWIPAGDKSISHRAIILASLAEGDSQIKNFLKAETCLATARAFKMMGIELIENKGELIVKGKGLYGLRKPLLVLDVGNSGTALRLLTGLLSAQSFSSTITGDHSLVKRPMKELIFLLQKMGARLEGRDDNSYAPICISPSHGGSPRGLAAIQCELGFGLIGNSAQIKSAVLLAGLYADGTTEIKETLATRDHTERLLKYMGGTITQEEGRITIEKSSLKPVSLSIPGDISSASFLIALALLLPDSKLEISSVGLNPARMGFLEVVKQMGGGISFEVMSQDPEPQGNIHVTSSHLSASRVSGALTIRTIDELPLVALLATQAQGETKILDAASLRTKESDRLLALTQELSKMGAHIQEGQDGLVIEGPTSLTGAQVKSHDDHRIAMTLVLAGLIAKGETVIDHIDVISNSFPRFIQTLKELSSS